MRQQTFAITLGCVGALLALALGYAAVTYWHSLTPGGAGNNPLAGFNNRGAVQLNDFNDVNDLILNMPQADAPLQGPFAAGDIQAPGPKTEDAKVSGPYTHGNLALFLIHGPDLMDGKLVTLQEALEQNLAVVHDIAGLFVACLDKQRHQVRRFVCGRRTTALGDHRVDQLIELGMAEFLTMPDERFRRIADRVIEENKELYRRLA